LNKKPSSLPGTVEKVIKSRFQNEPEKAQIALEGADHLYRELRIENVLTNENGDEVSLKPAANRVRRMKDSGFECLQRFTLALPNLPR
jgi:hypothetical protein